MRIFSPTGMNGQGLAEYSLIGSLVLVLSIPVMMMIGGNLNGFLELLHKTSSEKVLALKKNAALRMTALGNSGGDAQVAAHESSDSNTIISSLMEKIPDSPAELAATVETLGANGATKMLADSLEAIAKEQLASGEITKTQYDDLIALAEQGHALGRLERILEDTVASADSVDVLLGTTLTWDNRQDTFYDLYANVGFTQAYDVGLFDDPLHAQEYAYGEMKEFLSLFAKVESGGAFDNPALKSVVTNLSQEIAWTGDALVFALEDMRGETQPPKNVDIQANAAKRLVADLADYQASESTHQNSQGICKAGAGQDSGQACFTSGTSGSG